MRSLEAFAERHGLEVVNINYVNRISTLVAKGYDLINPDTGMIVVKVEPKAYEWMVVVLATATVHYTRRMTGKFLDTLEVNPEIETHSYLRNHGNY